MNEYETMRDDWLNARLCPLTTINLGMFDDIYQLGVDAGKSQDSKPRQLAELEVHFHRWTLHETGLPAVVVTYVDLVMRKRPMMALQMSAEELQNARVLGVGPWTASTKAFARAVFTEDDLDSIRGIDAALEALYGASGV